MKRSLLAAAVVLVPSLASAESVAPQRTLHTKPFTAQYFDIVATKPTVNDLQFARQFLPPVAPPTIALAQSRVIYLNRTGVTVTPGNNDSRQNRSTIAQQSTTIAPWNTDTTTWNATVACVRELFSPFGVTVVENDPGNVPHIEAVFGGSPQQFGMPANVAGVSPFTQNCSIIENAIVYTFTNVLPNDSRLACEIQAQEIAHAFGLDHELLASDPMTYLDYNGNRSFKNQQASCGEDVQRACGINGSVCRNGQNSVALLTERLGPAGTPGDNVAPTLNITSPSNNATVPPGFDLLFNAADNVNLAQATLYVDDEPAGSVLGDETLKFKTPNLPDGEHTFRIEVTDGANTKTDEITVRIQKGAPAPGGGADDTNSNDIVGGCSTGGSTSGLSLLLGLGLVGMLLRRRR